MESIASKYMQWVLAQDIADVHARQVDGDHVCFEAESAVAEVNVYRFDDGPDIVELRVSRGDDNAFFLHFMLDDLARAKELFGQMADALLEECDRQACRVLLSCTSGLTTSFFAQKLNEIASTLGLDYEFEALPIDQALSSTEPYAAIMLAPQAAYQQEAMSAAHPYSLVFELPAKIFGSYDAAGALRLLMHAMHRMGTPGDGGTPLKAVRDLSDDRRVLVITLFSLGESSRLGWRLFDRGTVQAAGLVRKPQLDYRDIEDLIETLMARKGEKLGNLDAIALAVPGVTFRGFVRVPSKDEDIDLGQHLSERFGLPVYVDNNCNAAAVGCYVTQDEVESLVFYRHAFGHPAGGYGTVIDGRLLKGRGNLAGETHFFERYLPTRCDPKRVFWSEDGLFDIARSMALISISLTAPEAMYLAVDTVDDMDALHNALAKDLGDEYVPPLHVVTDYRERVYLGTLAMALQKLRDPHYRSLGTAEQAHSAGK